MKWTRIDATRWIVVSGLIVGPALLAASVLINLTPPGESMRADFDTMAQRSGLIVAEALLETIGFMIVLACFAGASHALRARGGALGTWGAALSITGIVGFSFSNANGFTLAELAQLPDRDAAFGTAMAITSSETAALTSTIGTAMEVLGQIGILLVIGGLMRAHIVRIWPLLIVVVGMIVNVVIGMMLTTLIADLLLLAASTWIAVRLARCDRDAWLGAAGVTRAEPVEVSV